MHNFNAEEAMAIEGYSEPWELEWLFNHADCMDSYLEIGCYFGRTACAVSSSSCRLIYTVDHFKGSITDPSDPTGEVAKEIDIYEQAQKNLQNHNVEIINKSSIEASRMFAPDSIDMVFIDGAHDSFSCLTDIMAWYPKTRHLFCGHDRDWPGVQNALISFGIPYELGPGSIWYLKIRR